MQEQNGIGIIGVIVLLTLIGIIWIGWHIVDLIGYLKVGIKQGWDYLVKVHGGKWSALPKTASVREAIRQEILAILMGVLIFGGVIYVLVRKHMGEEVE